jgi:hypothetical protein
MKLIMKYKLCWKTVHTVRSWFCGLGFLGVAFGLGLLAPQAAGGAEPIITTPPTNQTVAVGETVDLSVTATGDAPLSYQCP